MAGAIAAGLVLAAMAPAAAQQQQQRPAPQQQQQQQQQRQQPPQQAPQQPAGERVQVVELTQALIERWIVLFGDLAPKLAKAQNLSEQQVDAIVAQSCQKAQLPNIDQCRGLDAYMGALLSGADEQSKRFVDPVQRVRQDLQASQADQRLSPQEKAEAKAELEGLLAQMPTQIPPAHLQLVNRNATRIFDLLARVQPPEQQQGGQQQGGQQGQRQPQGGPPPPAPGQGQPRR